jgi:hypothetical protein
MPTIAEIIAAKKVAAASAISAAKAAPPRQPTADDLEVEAAINRIDPPGKRRGLVVSNKPPLAQATTPPPAHKENRSLSQTKGEAIPMMPSNADAETQTWHSALNAFETELCVMRDPMDSEVAWLAIRPYRAGMPPILLHRLPWLMWDYPHKPTENEPF